RVAEELLCIGRHFIHLFGLFLEVSRRGYVVWIVVQLLQVIHGRRRIWCPVDVEIVLGIADLERRKTVWHGAGAEMQEVVVAFRPTNVVRLGGVAISGNGIGLLLEKEAEAHLGTLQGGIAYA